jgi:quinol monooxygenase YgiN
MTAIRVAEEALADEVARHKAERLKTTRREPGNLGYDVYRGQDDDQVFYIVEHWASPAALAAHQRSEVFVHYGQGVLVKYATLHDTVTASAFDVVRPPLPSR